MALERLCLRLATIMIALFMIIATSPTIPTGDTPTRFLSCVTRQHEVYVAMSLGMIDKHRWYKSSCNGKPEVMNFPPNAIATQASLAENVHARGHAEFSGSNADFSIVSAVMLLNRTGRVDFSCA